MQDQKEYGVVDVGKFIMAIFVVAIHTRPMVEMENNYIKSLLSVFLDCAVPFFFITSGYFIELKRREGGDLLDRLRKLIIMYIVSSAAYLPLAIYHYVDSDCSILYAAVHYLRSFALVGSNYNSAILWYLLSSIYSLAFVIMMFKRERKLTEIVIVGFCVFCFGIACSTLVEIREQLPEMLKKVASLVNATIRNGRIFSGFFYLPLGMLFAHVNTSKLTGIIAMLIGSLVGTVTENPFYSLSVSVASVGVFIIATQTKLKPSPIYYLLRKSSVFIYFTHMYIWTCYCGIRYGTMEYGIEPFVVVSSISILLGFAHALVWTKRRRKKNRWILENTLTRLIL